jgi:hypothetical protein
MIHQIIITDEEGMRVLEAVVDVKRRRVTQLSLEENYPAVVSAFVGLATLSAVIEGELVAEDARMKSPGVPVNDTLLRSREANREQTVAEWAESRIVAFSATEKASPFPGLLIVDDLTEAKRIGKERLKPGLLHYQEVLKTPGASITIELLAQAREQMARAMGLVAGFLVEDSFNITCEGCRESRADWCGTQGGIFVGYCDACLPAAYDAHVIEQGELDRLVEVDDGLKLELRTEKRAEDLKCEGGRD